MREVARILLQKAITHQNDVLPESSKSNAEETKTEEITSQMESKAREDLRLIKIARELEEMQIFDNKTASLLLFEAM